MLVQTLDAPTIRAKSKEIVDKNDKVPPAALPTKQPPLQTIKIPAHLAMHPVYIPEIELPNPDLPSEDGIPLESNWHRAEGNLLIDSYQQHRGTARNYYAAASMFIYFSIQQIRNHSFRGPDFFIVLDVDGSYDRRSWVLWEENGRYPNVIIELMSNSTSEEDRTTKRALYASTFSTPNYFYFHPDTQEFQGFHLVNRLYQELLPDPRGWFWCNALGLWLGTWEGEYQGQTHTWLRFYDQNGNLILTKEEAERQRAEAAETELTRMRARLRQLGIDPDKE